MVDRWEGTSVSASRREVCALFGGRWLSAVRWLNVQRITGVRLMEKRGVGKWDLEPFSYTEHKSCRDQNRQSKFLQIFGALYHYSVL